MKNNTSGLQPKPVVKEIERPLKSRIKNDSVNTFSAHRKLFIAILVVSMLVLGGFIVSSVTFTETPKAVVPIPKDVEDELAYRNYVINSEGYQATYADYLILGNEYLKKNKYVEAESQYKKAESLKGDSSDVQYALATVYRLQKNKSLSLKYYDKLIKSASKKDSSNSMNLALYETERNAVEQGNFELTNVKIEGTNELPL